MTLKRIAARLALGALSLGVAMAGPAWAAADASGPSSPAPGPTPGGASGAQASPTPPSQAFTPVSEFSDVSPSSWAYRAVKKLVEKYHIMGGFPDGTFRGNQDVTRFQLAVVLDKVMHRVEQLTAESSPSTETLPPPPAPGANTARPIVSPEDLHTIARLQQDFKDELQAIEARQDTFDQRLISLEKRVRLGGGLAMFFRTYTASRYGQNNLRIATHLKLNADLASDLTYSGQLMMLDDGVQHFFNGHQASDGGANTIPGDDATPLYIRKSFLSWTPPSVTIDAGMMRFSDILPVGSAIANDFATGPVWPQGESGYGFVGTPPVQNGHIDLYNPTVSVAGPDRAPYHPGVNVVQDLLDPDSAADLNDGSAGTLAVDATLGPVELGAGINDGTPGAETGEELLNLPDTFPRIAQLNDGYGLAKVGIDLGLLRASVVAHADNSALGQLSDASHPAGKGLGGTIDIGNDLGGLSLSFAEINRTALAAATDANYYHEASAVLSTTSFLGLGLGAGIAAKVGLAPIAGYAVPDPTFTQMGLSSGGKPRSQLIPGLPYNWASTGVYLRFPGFSVIPDLTLAYQTSGWDLMDSNFGSGLSAILEIQPLPELPRIFVEYDQGKFSSSPYKWNALFSTVNPNPTSPSAAAITHEQFIVGTSVAF